MRPLLAIYDLEVIPPNYDFVAFLQLADLARVRRGKTAVFVIIVPGRMDGFRADNIFDVPASAGRLRNIVMPACHLLPSLCGVQLVDDRRELAEMLACRDKLDIFPFGYMVEAPFPEMRIRCLGAAVLRGEKVRTLSAPAEHLDLARRYLDHVSGGRHTVTVTLRECGHEEGRNSDLGQWFEFIRGIDREKFCPIVIRDTSMAMRPDLMEGIVTCDLASIDLLFRAGLYQASRQNLFTSNGPAFMSILTGATTIIVGMLNESGPSTNGKWLREVEGILPGRPFAFAGRNQAVVWEKETSETIDEAFRTQHEMLEREETDGPWADWGFVDGEQIRVKVNAVFGEILGRFRRGLRAPEDTETLGILLGLVSDDPDIWTLLGAMNLSDGDPLAALHCFDACVRLRVNDPKGHSNRGLALEALNRRDEAVGAFLRAQALAPNPSLIAKIRELRSMPLREEP